LSFWKTVTLILGISALIAAILLIRSVYYPSAGDSWAYRFYAFRFRLHYPLYDFGTVRTYGYALFLYFLTFLSGWSHLGLAITAGVVQWALYAAAALGLAIALRQFGRAVSLGALAGMMLLLPSLALVTDVLTEGLSLPIAVALAALAVVATGDYRRASTETVLFAGAALAAFAVMVRPANIPLLIGWYAGVGVALAISPAWASVRTRLAGSTALSFAVASMLVCGPQALYAAQSVGEWAVLPLCRIGVFQLVYGTLVLKYDTIMNSPNIAGAAPWNTVNPFFVGTLSPGYERAWFFTHPLQAIATVAGHVFMSFNARTPFTYIYDLHPIYGWPYRATIFLIVVLGGWRLWDVFRRMKYFAFRCWALPVVYVFVSGLLVCAINGISAVEARFAAIPLTILASLAAWHIWAVASGGETLSLARLGASSVAVGLFLAASAWTDRYEGREVARSVHIADFISNTCLLTFDTAYLLSDKPRGGVPEVYAGYERMLAQGAARR
jgi:hypothetical protein